MRFLRILTAALLGSCTIAPVVMPPNAAAQTIFEDDFQSGNAVGWLSDPGKGTIGLSSYGDNVSLKMTHNAYALRKVDNILVRKVRIGASFAASGLEGNDICKLEASSDGKAWFELGRIGDGDDDGVTLHQLSGNIEINPKSGTLFLGLRVAGNGANDTCWADNITVTSIIDPASLPREVSEDVLAGRAKLSVPLSTEAFMIPTSAQASDQSFSGRLEFAGARADNFEILLDSFNYLPTAKQAHSLPPFAIDFVQYGTDFIPAPRGPQPVDHLDWEWIFEPGKIWEKPAGGASVSLPFAFQERNANCTHNGLMRFDISSTGKPSNMVYQIGSETCSYSQFNMYGSSSVVFTLRRLPDVGNVTSNYAREKSARLPVRPASDLPRASAYANPLDVPADSLTVFGYVTKDTHYSGGCETRFGVYPFCDVLDLPSYSWAKSLVGGVAAMRLEKLYPGAMQSKIKDYVPACSAWGDVTFEHALDMATGYYTSNVYDEDEASPQSRKFFMAETNAEKIDRACTMHKRRESPGQTFVYHTTDTYILGAAITAYLRQHSGDANADIYDTLLLPIWSDLGLSPVAMKIRRTYDDTAQAFTGWGLTLHRDDVAKLLNFLQRGGKIREQYLLDAKMLSSAMQRNPKDRGLVAVAADQRYQNGFWAWNAGPNIGCKNDVFVPIMSGYGGLTAAMLPNGDSYYYVSDGKAFAWARAARASNESNPFCEVK